MSRKWALFLLFGLSQSLTVVHAAQLALVDAVEAEVYESPDAKSSVVGVVKKGEYIAASNLPTLGFYKVRLPNKAIGWVSAEILVLNPQPPEGASTEQNQTAQTLMAAPELESESIEKKGLERDRSEADQVVRIRALYSLGFLNWSDFTTVTGFESPTSIQAAAMNLEFFIFKSFSLILRGEWMFGGVEAIDESNNTYSFSLSSLPVYGGLGFTIGKEREFSLGFGALAGLGLNTQFSSVANTQSAPNETSFTSAPLAFLVNLHLTYFFSQNWGFVGEAGYRILSTGAVAASTTGNGSGIFSGPLTINYGGLFFSLGIGLRF